MVKEICRVFFLLKHILEYLIFKVTHHAKHFKSAYTLCLLSGLATRTLWRRLTLAWPKTYTALTITEEMSKETPLFLSSG